jgi:serine/threonine protein phosphatase PrpC
MAVAAVRGAGQDRAGIFDGEDGLAIVLADGAGGTGNGAVAAQAIVDAVGAIASAQHDWCALLSSLDRDRSRLGHGESTAVIVAITEGIVSGASVGDSGAWLVSGTETIDLTEAQHRKPLVGGGCVPYRIPLVKLGDGLLLVASDGLLRYARRADIVRIARGPDLATAAQALIDFVRLRSGALQDDVSVVLCALRRD